MPRSLDGRWTRKCVICDKEFTPRREKHVACSVACRAKIPHNTGGWRAQEGLDQRKCEVCGVLFDPYRASQVTCTPECYRKSAQWQAVKDRTNERRRTDPETVARIRKYQRADQLKRRYGVTVEECDAKLTAQGGVCMICSQPPNPNGKRAASRLHQDHDHVTGQNRDLVCSNCNQGLGYFQDNPELMRLAAAYIERHRQAVLAETGGQA